jgi:hypothetical protein
MSAIVTHPPGWLYDPAGRHDLRYWDGSGWTEHVIDAGERTTDPPGYFRRPAIDPPPVIVQAGALSEPQFDVPEHGPKNRDIVGTEDNRTSWQSTIRRRLQDAGWERTVDGLCVVICGIGLLILGVAGSSDQNLGQGAIGCAILVLYGAYITLTKLPYVFHDVVYIGAGVAVWAAIAAIF